MIQPCRLLPGLNTKPLVANFWPYRVLNVCAALLAPRRFYTLVFGATLLPFGLIPSFRKMRVILVVGVIGTLYTGCYGIYVASQKGFADAAKAHVLPVGPSAADSFLMFFNGVSVIFAILDHHDIFAETIEAMQHPRK